MNTFQAIKITIKLQSHQNFSFKKSLVNEKVTYTLVSLISHYGESLDFGHYVSNYFYFNTEIWWHCDDANITEISAFPEGVYTRESHKQTKQKRKLISGSKDILFVVYIMIEHLIASGSVFFQEFNDMSKKHHMKKV